MYLIIYIGGDHSAWNAASGWWVPAFNAIRSWLPWMPAIALAVAWWLDRERHRAVSGAEVALAAEAGASPPFPGCWKPRSNVHRLRSCASASSYGYDVCITARCVRTTPQGMRFAMN